MCWEVTQFLKVTVSPTKPVTTFGFYSRPPFGHRQLITSYETWQRGLKYTDVWGPNAQNSPISGLPKPQIWPSELTVAPSPKQTSFRGNMERMWKPGGLHFPYQRKASKDLAFLAFREDYREILGRKGLGLKNCLLLINKQWLVLKHQNP